MKLALLICVFAAVLLSCVQGNDGKPVIVDLSSKIIDVRTVKEYNNGHLKNAVNIPYDKIGERIADYVKNKEDKIAVYCRIGSRASIAKRTLNRMGYSAVVNAGSYAKLKGTTDVCVVPCLASWR